MIRKIIYGTVLSILIPFIACESGSKELFWIDAPQGQENDLLFLAESTNLPEIKPDSLIHYLTTEEIFSAEKMTFKDFGVIHEDDRFTVHILLKQGSDNGRDYTFIVRTFNKDFKIIDSYDLATWIDSEDQYCFGSIDKDLIIVRSCDGGKNKDVRQILDDGRIHNVSGEN